MFKILAIFYDQNYYPHAGLRTLLGKTLTAAFKMAQ